MATAFSLDLPDMPDTTAPESGAPRTHAGTRIFSNRTMNLHRIRAIGYDMDYTLIHYNMRVWEQRAYEHVRDRLAAQGWPVENLRFDADLVVRGLIIDASAGNIVKANRFGYGKRAFHGTRPLSYSEMRAIYERVLIDVAEPRWYFLNTLFSISEACIYLQLVDMLDRGELPGELSYHELYTIVRRSIDATHVEGSLKAEIIAQPETFVVLDPDMPVALWDQKLAGKKVLLITNSDWAYAAPMLTYAIDPFLPDGLTWKDLFDIAIVGARKPDFFTTRMPAFEVVTSDGLLREHVGLLEPGKVYHGANASLVEESLGLHGEEILYVGDHIEVDVGISKSMLRWRTALVVPELDDDILASGSFREQERELDALMIEKEALEHHFTRLRREKMHRNYPQPDPEGSADLDAAMTELRERFMALDARIAPLADAASRLGNPHWGLLMRTGNDKSYVARQVETFADIYMTRVSDFAYHTPFAYFRSHRGSLPHDV